MLKRTDAKRQRIELLDQPIRIESKRLKPLLQGMLARMLEPFWPMKHQALWIERQDLRELAPFMQEIANRLELGGKVHWAGDEIELSQLMGKTDASGLTVVIGGDRLTDSMQRTLMQMELKARFRFTFLTELDPGKLLECKLWRKDFREMVLTNRWPTANLRREDWKALFHAGIGEATEELGLTTPLEIEKDVYRELMSHTWNVQDGAIAIMEFGAKCVHTAYAYSHGKPDKIAFEHARVSHERPIEMTAAQARETQPPPPGSEAIG